MVKIKICGITNLDDARDAVAAGADMLGFNFYRPSPRFIEPRDAREIINELKNQKENSDRFVRMVGVFVNELAPEDVVEIMQVSRVDAAQLHGDETAEFCNGLKRSLPDRFVIKVFRVGPAFEPPDSASYNVDAIMLDAFDKKLYGGTGRVVDWSIAQKVRAIVPRLFLSGGLSPENVAEAIAAVQPYAVDACSALEVAPGSKDSERVKAFVRAVRAE
jgi:phosphoribosylanthranilate isomerase